MSMNAKIETQELQLATLDTYDFSAMILHCRPYTINTTLNKFFKAD